MVGESQHNFKITLNKEYYKSSDILITTNDGRVHIIGDVETFNNKWYHRLINFITFKKYCNKYYVYNCEFEKITNNEQNTIH